MTERLEQRTFLAISTDIRGKESGKPQESAVVSSLWPSLVLFPLGVKCHHILEHFRKSHPFKSFQEGKNYMWYYSSPFFLHLHAVGQLRVKRKLSNLKVRSFPDLHTLIRSPGRPLTIGRLKILIPWFNQFPPILPICDIAHPLPLWSIGRNFPFSEDLTRMHSS